MQIGIGISLAASAVAGKAPFDPNTLPGLLALIVPGLSAAADGAAITALPNQCTAAGHALWDATGTAHIKTGLSPNGKRVARFDGVSDLMQNSGAVTLAQPFQQFIALREAGPITYAAGVYVDGKISGSAELYHNGVGEGPPQFVMKSAAFLVSNGTPAAPDTTGGFHLYEALFNGATSSLVVDSVTIMAGDAGVTADAGGYTLMAQGNSVFPVAGDVAGFAIFSPPLAGANLASMRAYMATL